MQMIVVTEIGPRVMSLSAGGGENILFLEGANYPDNGCSIEAYTCNVLIELETLSPSYILYPEEEFCHDELWFITPQTVDPYDGVAVRELCKK